MRVKISKIKKFIYEFITKFFDYFHKLKIREISTSFSVQPQPKYISQFVDIYSQDIKPGQKLDNKKHIEIYGAKDSDEFSFWVWRNCGVACVKMILDTLISNHKKTIMNLTQEGIKFGGYIVYDKKNQFIDKGWFHSGLVLLLRSSGIKATKKRWQTAASVANDVLKNKFVIISVQIPGRVSISPNGDFLSTNNSALMGHLMLVTRVEIKNGNVIGFWVHDPRGLPNYQKNTWIPLDTFEKIFSARSIVAN